MLALDATSPVLTQQWPTCQVAPLSPAPPSSISDAPESTGLHPCRRPLALSAAADSEAASVGIEREAMSQAPDAATSPVSLLPQWAATSCNRGREPRACHHLLQRQRLHFPPPVLPPPLLQRCGCVSTAQRVLDSVRGSRGPARVPGAAAGARCAHYSTDARDGLVRIALELERGGCCKWWR